MIDGYKRVESQIIKLYEEVHKSFMGIRGIVENWKELQ
jgi:hypothetical protein